MALQGQKDRGNALNGTKRSGFTGLRKGMTIAQDLSSLGSEQFQLACHLPPVASFEHLKADFLVVSQSGEARPFDS